MSPEDIKDMYEAGLISWRELNNDMESIGYVRGSHSGGRVVFANRADNACISVTIRKG